MKRIILYIPLLLMLNNPLTAQKWFTKNGTISFFSKTPIENISADNNQVVSVLNTQNGEFNFSVIMRSFHFKKALMEEHFNENYVESEKYPKAIFKGVIASPSAVNFSSDGNYAATVSGDLTLHGITRKTTALGTITIKAGKITANSKFVLKLADFNINIPKVVKSNIAETIEITVSCNYQNKL